MFCGIFRTSVLLLLVSFCIGCMAQSKNASAKIGSVCKGDSDCGSNAGCLIVGCDMQCQCDGGFLVDVDNIACVPARSKGEPCSNMDRCGMFLVCYSGSSTCDCAIPLLGTCVTPMITALPGESCQDYPCDDQFYTGLECSTSKVCDCASGYRHGTATELAVNILYYCVKDSFDLGYCSPPPPPPTTDVPVIKGLYEVCTGQDQCSQNASCQANGCEMQCSCDEGYSPDDSMTSCYPAALRIFETCFSTSQCPDNASCLPNGNLVQCKCDAGFIPSKERRLCIQAKCAGNSKTP